jgi:excisionase family DNA binding protein
MDNPFEILIAPLFPRIKEMLREVIREEKEAAKEPFADLPEYLTNKETCQILNISQTTLNRYVKEGKPKRYKMGKNGCTPRFKKSDVLQTFKTLNKYERR